MLGFLMVSLAYIHLAQFEPALGGMASGVEIYYVASDGVTQTSRETTDDRIKGLKLGRVSIDADFIERVFKLASVPIALDKPDPGVVYDASPARTRLLICLYDGTTLFWEGDTANAPKSIAEAIGVVIAFIGQAVPEAMSDAEQYIRVRQMDRHPPQLPRRSYIVPNSSELEPGGLLSNAIEHPYRLIPNSEDNDPPFAYRRKPERPVSFVIDKVAYRINFLKLIANQKEQR